MSKGFVILLTLVAALQFGVFVQVANASGSLFENVDQASNPPMQATPGRSNDDATTPIRPADKMSVPLLPKESGEVRAVTNSVMDSLDNQYQLGPGDSILYQVVEDQDTPTNLTVSDSGDLELPYYGLVRATGKNCRQLAFEIKPLLEKKLYYQATVVIALQVANKTWVAGKVYVTGQVRNPGGYDIKAGEKMTASKAILDAGGFSDFSDKKHVRLIRKTDKGDQTFIVNVADVWKGQLNGDLAVQPGDLVVVPARLMNY
jgi:protein involved in polysaccharide export with SLBB domain